MRRKPAARAWLATLTLAAAGTAWAEPEPAVPFAGLDEAVTVSEGELAAARGADGDLTIVRSEQNFASHVEGASFNAGTIANGEINIGDRAFDGFSGIGVNVMNTGNSNAFSTGVTTIINLH